MKPGFYIVAVCAAFFTEPVHRAPAAGPTRAEQEIVSSKWWIQSISGSVKYTARFLPNGTVQDLDGRWDASQMVWTATGERTFTLKGFFSPDIPRSVTFNETYTSFASEVWYSPHAHSITGWKLQSLTPGSAAPASAVSSVPTPAPAPSAPPPPIRSPADQRSQLANFYSQIPNTAAWAHAPLNVDEPPDLLASLIAFRRGLANESLRSAATMRPAYGRADVLAETLANTVTERAGFRQQFPGPNPPPAAATARWGELASGLRTNFKTSRGLLDDAVRAGGGVGKAVPIVAATLPLANLPPAPANARSPDFDASPPHKHVYASGPSGTNFGAGSTPIKLGISVDTDSDVPLPLIVDAYWVVMAGKNYRATNADHREVSVSGGHASGYDVNAVLHRTNGRTSAPLLNGTTDPYKGWVVTLHDTSGALVGCASSTDYFPRLVQ